MRITVLILTKNEEIHVARAILSVQTFAKSIVVIDSGSTDRTAEIATSLGARVLSHKWKNYAAQFQWGVDQIGEEAEWIMRLDADEYVECELSKRIEEMSAPAGNITGIYINRKHVFMDKWIRYGGRYPLTLLRIFKRGCARIEQRWMDEHILLTEGNAIEMGGGLVDHNLKGLDFFIEKHNQYATRESIDILAVRHNLSDSWDRLTANPVSSQAATKRWLKESVYNKIPYEVSTALYFFYRYFILLGFLDGRPGLAYHFLQGYWYRFLVGAKTRELEIAIKGLSSDQKKERLSEVTGLNIA